MVVEEERIPPHAASGGCRTQSCSLQAISQLSHPIRAGQRQGEKVKCYWQKRMGGGKEDRESKREEM